MKHVPPKMFTSAMEREAHDMREALLALECDYDEANVLSMSERAREIYWKLKEAS